MKTSELVGPALDWAVASANGYIKDCNTWLYEATLEEINEGSYHPSTDWAQGGTIIEREEIEIRKANAKEWHGWMKTIGTGGHGQTPLIAAMRCYVESKLGSDVHIPKEITT